MSISRTGVLVLVLSIAGCASGPQPTADRSRATAPEAAPSLDTAPTASMPPAVAESVPPAPETTEREDTSVVPSAQPSQQSAPSAKAGPVVSTAPVSAPKPAASAMPVDAPKPVVGTTSAVPLAAAAAKPESVAQDTPQGSSTTDRALPPAGSPGARIHGQLELVAATGQVLGAEEMSHAVVYFTSDETRAAVKPGRFLIYTHNKVFEPESLVIPLGSTVSFPNRDEILHNVFSVTPQASFDLGIYGEGKSQEYTFKKTGLVLINCNVHHAMQANVLVIDTPYMTTPDSAGRFELANLPAGDGKLSVWHPRATIQTKTIVAPANAPVALRLVLTKPRITEHLNKENKAY